VTDTLLELEAVTTRLRTPAGEWNVIEGVDLAVGRGQIVGLVGESGSGKSMTARTILGLLPSNASVSGSVRLDGVDLLGLKAKQLRATRAKRLGMIFQDPRAHIDPLYSIRDYLSEGLTVHGGRSRGDARTEALRLLGEVGIEDGERVLRAYPHQLSGGMLQRVMIAAAIALEPDMIIADEATTALDVTIQREIVSIFADLRRDRGLAMIFITHDLDLASALCDRVLVMYAGRIVEHQPAPALFAQPLHPYTSALLAARPRVDDRSERLPVIPGRPVQPFERPEGCPFHPRCAFAQDRCLEGRPPLRAIVPGGDAACVRSEELIAEGALQHA
jgi:oligopeptide/dipeptide ABC transporter ATP-binding protein